MPLSFLRGAKRLRWRETDRLLAVALRIYEDSLCPGCGERISDATDPVLAEYWTTMPPVRDHACTALARAHEAAADSTHPHALRHVVGLREGWEQAREQARTPPADH